MSSDDPIASAREAGVRLTAADDAREIATNGVTATLHNTGTATGGKTGGPETDEAKRKLEGVIRLCARFHIRPTFARTRMLDLVRWGEAR